MDSFYIWDLACESQSCAGLGKFCANVAPYVKSLYQEAVDKIQEDYTVGEAKMGDLSGVYGYDIYYNKANYELAYTVEYLNNVVVVIMMAGTRENFYDQLKQYNDY